MQTFMLRIVENRAPRPVFLIVPPGVLGRRGYRGSSTLSLRVG